MRKITKPTIGRAIMIVKFLMVGVEPAVEVDVMAVVVVGNSVELKILEGAMANAVPSCAWK
jgi:hypothetical protein